MLVDKINLEPGEKVIIQTRRHWFIIGGQITAITLIGLLPLLAILFILVLSANSGNSLIFNLADYTAEFIFAYLFYLSFIWVTIFSIWTNYYLDLLTITNRRAVLIDHKAFFWRTVTSFRLERMQDMHIEVNGMLATILNFGTLKLETASYNQEEFTATGIPDPASIKNAVLQATGNLSSASPQNDGIGPNK